MFRDIISIDEETCIGCGRCADACAEGAIKMIGGKAKLVNEAHCDGLGACLPSCPVDAISIGRKDVSPFKNPVPASIPSSNEKIDMIPMSHCPGSGSRRIIHDEESTVVMAPSLLSQWPVQIRLVSPSAPYLENCDLLIAADCSAYACGCFHERFIKNRIVLIGCPKLDPQDCWSKLNEILKLHNIKSITVTRMDVPCCSGLVGATLKALESSNRPIPLKVFTIYANGKIEENRA